jgi:hypothetical protein
MRTRNLLLDHFKKFSVSGPGGLMVTKDMTQYTDLLRSWDIDPETKGPGGALDVLLEVGSLFVIGVEALRERIRGGGATAAGGAQSGSGASASGSVSGSVSGSGSGSSSAGQRQEVKLSVTEVRAYVSRREDSGSLALQQVLNAL